MVPPASHRVSRAPWYSGTVIPQPHGPPVRYGTLTRSGGPSQTLRVDPISSRCPSCDELMLPSQPQPHPLAEVTLVWAPARFARHYYGPLPNESTRVAPLVRGLATPLLIPLPRCTEMFQFHRCPPDPQSTWSRPITDEGLPHSESVGSSLACSSPTTFRRAPRPSSAPGP